MVQTAVIQACGAGAGHATVMDADGSVRPLDRYDAPLLLADKAGRRFHIMAKPTGPTCNLGCSYCYYLGKGDLPDGPRAGRMSEQTLELFIRRYIEGVGAAEVVFSWQGGEPTLLGVDFFRRVVELQRKHARVGQTVQNDLQTNGTQLDESWCLFLKHNRFLVGLSIDGPRDIHDQCRVAKNGAPTFDRVMDAVRLLKRHGVAFNTLTCVHRYNARRPLEVYRFLRREVGSTSIQFIPIVEHRDFARTAPQTWDAAALPTQHDPRARPGHPDSIVTDWSVDPQDWGYFLCRVFDEWRSNDLGKVYVNHFETLVAQHMGLPSQMCSYAQHCGKCLAIEHDGSLYACDHYVYPQYRVGDIRGGDLGDIVLSRPQVKFGYAKSETLTRQCRACVFLSDCWGECPKNRIIRSAQGETGLNYLCSGFKQFFAHATPKVEQIVDVIRKRAARRPVPQDR